MAIRFISKIMEPSTRLYLVDWEQQIAKPLPPCGTFKFTVRAENWEPGKIYLPPGAKIVNATHPAHALQVVEKMLNYNAKNEVHGTRSLLPAR